MAPRKLILPNSPAFLIKAALRLRKRPQRSIRILLPALLSQIHALEITLHFRILQQFLTPIITPGILAMAQEMFPLEIQAICLHLRAITTYSLSQFHKRDA